jgi:sugar lactone lactonase YvrE
MTNVVGQAGTSSWTGDGGPASAAKINGAKDAVFDSYGNLYIVDDKNYVIRMVYAGGSGNPAANLLQVLKESCATGTAPGGGNCTVNAAPVAGDIYTIAGTHGTASNGSDGVLATATTLDAPYGIAVDSNGNIYIADPAANRVRVINGGTGIISNFAGSPAGTAPATSGDNAEMYPNGLTTTSATSALLNYPVSVVVDSSNNVYIADSKDCQVRVVPTGTTAGYLTGLTAGNIYAYAGDKTDNSGVCSYTATPPVGTSTPVLATSAKLGNPSYGLAIDASGNIYISDTGNYVIREVSASTGYMTTVAGNHTAASGVSAAANGGPATSAELEYVWKIAIDRLGNLVIADTNMQQVRYVNLSPNTVNGYMQPGYIYALADNGTAGDIPNLSAVTGAAISGEGSSTGVDGIAIDSLNNIYYVDYGDGVVRKINASGISPYVAASVGAAGTVQSFYAEVTATAGDTISSFQTASGFGDFTSGTESGCTLGSSNAVGTVCIEPVTFKPLGPGLRTAPLTLTDSSGNQYTLGLSGIGNAPQLAFTPGTITTVAGSGSAGYTGNGSAASGATLSGPSSAVVDTAGNIYIADTANNAVRMINTSGIISTVAGSSVGTSGSTGDSGLATSALLNGPSAVALDAADNLYIADTGNNKIREVLAQTGIISTIAGNGTSGSTGNGALATSAELSAPAGVAVDLYGNVYISDTGNGAVREVNVLNRFISAVATVTDPTGLSYAPSAAAITGLTGIYNGPSGVLLVASPSGSVVKQINLATKVVTTVAGSGTSGYLGDGSAATSAELTSPNSAVEDAAGNIYIADTGNSVLRRVDAYTGNISTIAGNGTAGNTGNSGAATSAELDVPSGVALDASANVYLVDSSADVLRKISSGSGSGALAFGSQVLNTTSSAQTLAVTNTGNLVLTFAALTVPANFAQVTGNSTDCSSTTSLAAGQSCYLRLTFTPTVGGNVSQTLLITSNTLNVAGTTSTATLTGSSPALTAPAITLSASLLNVVPGQALTLTATVTGSGTMPTGMVTFDVLSTGQTQGVLATVPLVNGMATYYGLIYVGTDTVTAIYNGDANYTGTTSSSITVTNASVDGKLAFNWPYLNWGQGVAYGASSGAWPVTLQNLTGVTVAVPSLSLSGPGSANFQITGNGCTSSLTQGATCVFNVVFAPVMGGAASGLMTTATLSASTATSSNYTNTLAVSGIAVSSSLAFNWPFLNFTPTVAVGATSSAWPVVLTNQSGNSTKLPSPAVSFTDASFVLSSDNCSGVTLPAGGSCTFAVSFSPLATDVTTSGTNIISETMTATGNSGAITGSLAVGGWAGSALAFNWPFLNFQPVPQGSTGTNPWSVTVTNYSSQALTGLTYSFSGVNNYVSGAFTLTNICSTLAAGASCTFDVVPTPQSSQTVGGYSATLVVSGTGSMTFSSYALTVSGAAIAGGYSINWNQDQQNGVSTIDFGPQNTKNVTAGPWPITVYNNMPSTETLTFTETPGLNATFTTGQSSSCTGVVSGGSCSFNLYFTPAADTEYQGTMTISDGTNSYTFNTWGGANK